MTALFLTNIKLVLLFLLVGATIALSVAGQRRTPRAVKVRPGRQAVSFRFPS